MAPLRLFRFTAALAGKVTFDRRIVVASITIFGSSALNRMLSTYNSLAALMLACWEALTSTFLRLTFLIEWSVTSRFPRSSTSGPDDAPCNTMSLRTESTRSFVAASRVKSLEPSSSSPLISTTRLPLPASPEKRILPCNCNFSVAPSAKESEPLRARLLNE